MAEGSGKGKVGRGRGRACALAGPLIAVGLGTGACSLSLPVSSLVDDDKPTNTALLRPASPLSAELGTEDWRRARGALAVAMDPHGNGSPVTWDNPDTTLRGTFAPVGQPFVRDDEICRAFIASITGQGSGQWLQGTACRLSGAEWSVRDVKPWKKPA